MLRLTTSICGLLVIFLLGGCSGGAGPQLEVYEDGAYKPIAVSDYGISGKREGATTRAVATLMLEDGDRLQLELEVSYDPKPVLGNTSWSIRGSRTGSGTTAAEALKFTGGQGEGPSLGGTFRLDENGSPRFRVKLPMRAIDVPKWTVDP